MIRKRVYVGNFLQHAQKEAKENALKTNIYYTSDANIWRKSVSERPTPKLILSLNIFEVYTSVSNFSKINCHQLTYHTETFKCM